MPDSRLSVTEYAVLGVLAEKPSHGFAISKELGPTADLGRVFTVRRTLVYRALDRMAGFGYAETISTEPGAGPQRVVYRVTPAGRRRLRRWLAEPVAHVRDMRLEFLLKLELHRRAGGSPLQTIRSQREALAPTLKALAHTEPDRDDYAELWRRHNALAALAFLDQLETLHQD
ncbi:MAG TPA: PadR family transcriptional regulator [Acidimicrobiia bacterium]